MTIINKIRLPQCPASNSLINKLFYRELHLHEYQAKELLQSHGVNVQKFFIVEKQSQLEPETLCAKIGNDKEYVIKAQIKAGGRGKGYFCSSGLQGGVHLSCNPKRVMQLCSQMLGDRLITEQTGQEGLLVEKVMIAEARELSKEAYLSILLDRKNRGALIVASPRGGMDIEKTAKLEPQSIVKLYIECLERGPDESQLEIIADALSLPDAAKVRLVDQIKRLYNCFLKSDAVQVEINPLGLTPEGELICFDAKIDIDDNAHYRQEGIFGSLSQDTQDPRETKARELGLNYLGLTGTVGCIVNGAGLAMATMDVLGHYKGNPANFLDVGGAASKKTLISACQFLLQDPQVKSIFVNIFGGIVRCDVVAEAIIEALKSTTTTTNSQKAQLVIRLAGTHEMQAKSLLSSCEFSKSIKVIDEFGEAARLAVELAY